MGSVDRVQAVNPLPEGGRYSLLLFDQERLIQNTGKVALKEGQAGLSVAGIDLG